MYKRLLLILFFCACGENSTKNLTDEQKNFIQKQQNETCDLNLNDCTIHTKNGTAQVLLTPRPIKSMVESSVIVKGLTGLKEPRIHLYGLSMYLGHLREKLELNQNNELEAQIMIAPCTEEKMLFRLEILDKDELNAYIDFELRR